MSQITNFTKLFEKDTDIYVSNISGCQVSVSFEVSPGHSEGYLFPNSKDPINLTRHIPFGAIKHSIDLRKMVNRNPPALRLMTEAEYTSYFENKAKSNDMSVDEALELAETRRVAAQNHLPLPDAVAPKKNSELDTDVNPEITNVSEADIINPRVLHLCLQVHPSVPDQSKMTAQAILAELDTLEGLTMQDWDYITSHGFYKSVIKLSKKKVAELAAAAVSEAPKAPKKKNTKLVSQED
jgi:hypothetical protein